MEISKLPPIEWLREHLDYNPETGVITLKKRWGPLPLKVGSIMGNWKCTDGYYQIKLQGVSHGTHRVAYAHYHGVDPHTLEIDHKNRDKTDNRICNLRLVTHRQNSYNRSQRESTSGYTGITHRTRRKKAWQVMCNRTYIGSYETLEEALAARAEAEKRMQRFI